MTRYRHLLSYFLLTFLFGCEEEIRNPLQTDQAVEGTEMFKVSFALEENLYYAFLDFDTYEQALLDTLELPGCPSLQVNGTTREVLLDFPANCDNSTVNRQGRIRLTFPETDTLVRTQEYIDYRIQNTTINGQRKYYMENGNPQHLLGHFEDIILLDEHESSTRISGALSHVISLDATGNPTYTTSGNGQGRNITGRHFTFEITTPKVTRGTCVTTGIFMASRGAELWNIERSTQLIQHRLNYGEGDICDNQARVSLSDGRNLELSP